MRTPYVSKRYDRAAALALRTPLRYPACMAVGRPFSKGRDERRHSVPPPKAQGETPLPKYVREKTRRGRALVDWLVAIADGTARATRSAVTKEGGIVELLEGPTHRDRLAAIRELWDRGLGTAIPSDKMPTAPEAAGAGEDAELAQVLKLLQQQPPPAEVAPAPAPERGGDSGDEGKGNGGAA